MQQGIIWLEQVSNNMKEAVTNGAAPTTERTTVRELLWKFGYQKRGDYVVSQIRNQLERFDLSTDQDLAVGWIDSSITISLDSEASDATQEHLGADPTHRISALEAANNQPISVHPDNELKAATTIMQLHDFSQLPVMTNERELSGVISWHSIGARLGVLAWSPLSIRSRMHGSRPRGASSHTSFRGHCYHRRAWVRICSWDR